MSRNTTPGIVRSLAIAALLAATLAPSGTIAAQSGAPGSNAIRPTPATVDQPRPFGHVIGDLVTQRVLLRATNSDFEPAALPPAQRLNVWLERREPRIEATADGDRWLVVDYQVINAPQTLTTVSLPAWELESKAGGPKLGIPAWPISVAPLTPRASFATGDLGELRADRPAPLIPTASIRRHMLIWSVALVITLVAWFAWLQWRERQDILNRPFARALRAIRRMDETSPQAWQTLHRAFDQTAGSVMQPESLPALFRRAPQLQWLRPQIEQFFEQSSERFYGAGTPGNSLSVLALCSELRQIERRYER